MRKYGAWIGLCVLLVLIVSRSVAAFGKDVPVPKRSEVFTVVQKGYAAQASLHGKKLSVEQMTAVLTPYFTDNFLQVFTDEQEDDAKGGGTHLLPAKAPFSFGDATKVAYNEEYGLLYVYEKIKNEYQIVTLQHEGGKWKMGAYHASEELLPEIKTAEQAEK